MVAHPRPRSVEADPTEQNNLMETHPQVAEALRARIDALTPTFWQNHDSFKGHYACTGDEADCACTVAKERYGSFLGPYAMLGPQ